MRHLWLHLHGEVGHYCGHDSSASPRRPGDSPCSDSQWICSLKGDPERPVLCESEKSQQAYRDRVPVEDSHVAARAEVSPQRQEKTPEGIERHSPHYIS